MNRRSLILLFLLYTAVANRTEAQSINRRVTTDTLTVPSSLPSQASDTIILSLEVFQQLVLRNHPIVRQANLLSVAARAEVMQSLGKFDPLLESSFDRKEFGNTDYYANWANQLKVPLWLAGADLKIGYDNFTGENVNPQYITPDQGLGSMGISIPLGQGFVIDARRNVLRQSRIMVRYAEGEKIKQILSVWYAAVSDYWSWYSAYAENRLLEEGIDLATTRFVALRGQTLIGDKPPIDTVEARITVQEREIQLAKLRVELTNRRLILNNHLWDGNSSPMELPSNAVPEQPDLALLKPVDVQLDSLISSASGQHPDLVMLKARASGLEVERAYRRELLKPVFNVSGSLLTARDRFGAFSPKYYDVSWQNYKVGFDFSLPLFLRAERGKLRAVRIRQEQVQLDLRQTDREIRNNIIAAYNSLQAYQSQLGIQQATIRNQEILLNAENARYGLGESTLFLINSRETKLIDMKMKQAAMMADYQRARAKLYYTAGVRPE